MAAKLIGLSIAMGSFAFVLAGRITPQYTGFMVSPFEGAEVVATDREVVFAGFLPNPGRQVFVQVKDHGSWKTIAAARSSRTSHLHYGKRWYRWRARRTVLDRFWQVSDTNVSTYRTEIRAVDATGSPLNTFVDDFNYFYDPDVSPKKLWKQFAHARPAVQIWYTQPNPIQQPSPN